MASSSIAYKIIVMSMIINIINIIMIIINLVHASPLCADETFSSSAKAC